MKIIKQIAKLSILFSLVLLSGCYTMFLAKTPLDYAIEFTEENPTDSFLLKKNKHIPVLLSCINNEWAKIYPVKSTIIYSTWSGSGDYIFTEDFAYLLRIEFSWGKNQEHIYNAFFHYDKEKAKPSTRDNLLKAVIKCDNDISVE